MSLFFLLMICFVEIFHTLDSSKWHVCVYVCVYVFQ